VSSPYQKITGDWPNPQSGQVAGTDETWARIHDALAQGYRGLPGGSSLSQLLSEYRGVRNQLNLPPLAIEQILVWADEYQKSTGDWPDVKSGQVAGTDETWAGINAALTLGYRGFRRGSSLAKILAAHRGVRNIRDLPPLTIKQILGWADAHQKRTGDWPNKDSGQVAETGETWLGIDASLRRGGRRLPNGSSLAILLAENRGVRNAMNLESMTIKQILDWADEHKQKTSDWPIQKSGQVAETNETWAGINAALSRGKRGLSKGSSLAKLLAEHRGVRDLQELSPLAVEQILVWADEHKERTGDWSNQNLVKWQARKKPGQESTSR